MGYLILIIFCIVCGIIFIDKYIKHEKKLEITLEDYKSTVNEINQNDLTYDLTSYNYFSNLFLLNLKKNKKIYSINKDNCEVIKKFKLIIFLLEKKSNLYLKSFNNFSSESDFTYYKYDTCRNIDTFVKLLKDIKNYLNNYCSFISKLSTLLDSTNFFNKEYSNAYLIVSLSLFETFKQVIENDSKEIISEDYLDDLLKELNLVETKSNFVNSKFIFSRDMKIDIDDQTVVKAINLFKS